MNTRPEPEAYLHDVERFARRTFQYRNEIKLLIDLSEQRSLQPMFDELLFLSKFATNSAALLKRVGTQGDETAKLSAEFSESLRKISSLIAQLTAEAPSGIANVFQRSFLDLSHDGMNRLMQLLAELCWIKNYLLDTHRSPFSTPSAS